MLVTGIGLQVNKSWRSLNITQFSSSKAIVLRPLSSDDNVCKCVTTVFTLFRSLPPSFSFSSFWSRGICCRSSPQQIKLTVHPIQANSDHSRVVPFKTLINQSIFSNIHGSYVASSTDARTKLKLLALPEQKRFAKSD